MNRSNSEVKVVNEIVHALDATIHAPTSPENFSCVAHGVEFLEDHLRRLYSLEEHSSLLEIIVHLHPELDVEMHRLQHERDNIRAEAHRLVLALENRTAPSDGEIRHLMCDLRHLISGILKHEHHERAVIIDAVNVDQGGEG